MRYPRPDVIHFFSDETRVSLELPDGWKLDETDVRFAMYRAAQDAFGQAPTLIVRVVDIQTTDPGAYKKLARQMLELPRKEMRVISRSAVTVDGFAGTVDVFSHYQDVVAQRVTQYQVFVQVERVIFSITGIVAQESQKAYLPVFEAAVQSIRFIPARAALAKNE